MSKLDALAKPQVLSAPHNLSVDIGTKVTFMQAAAPVGWTKDTTHDDKTLRVVSGTAANGGSQAFSTVFGAGKTASSHTLSTPQMPAHSHPHSSGIQTRDLELGNSNWPAITPTTQSTSGRGGSGSHSHSLSLDIQYVDIIIASKD